MKIPWLEHTFYKVQSGCLPPHLLHLERILTQMEYVHHYKKWVPTKLKEAKNLRHTHSMKKHNRDVSTTPLVVRLDDDEDEEDAEFFGAPGYIFYILILLNTFVPLCLSLFIYCFCEVKWKHSNMVPNLNAPYHLIFSIWIKAGSWGVQGNH